MNSSMACRYPRLDSGERRLSSTAALLWSRSGRPSFDFGRFAVADLRFGRLLIPVASSAAGRERTPAHRSVGHRGTPGGIVLRINIVLGAAEGLANRVLARKLCTSVPTVLLWRKRYESDGLRGILEDRPRSGRPKRMP